MKRLLSISLTLCLLFICSFAFADVGAKVKNVRTGDRDYIWIDVEYNIDGKKVLNPYPMDFKNTVGKTDQEIISWIDVNIDYQMGLYIEDEYRKKENVRLVIEKLSSIIGREYSKDTAVLKYDIDGSGIADVELSVKTDGTSVEKAINEAIIEEATL